MVNPCPTDVALRPACGEKVAGGRMRGGTSREARPLTLPLRGIPLPASGARGNDWPARDLLPAAARV
jgi:hypothetical protein